MYKYMFIEVGDPIWIKGSLELCHVVRLDPWRGEVVVFRSALGPCRMSLGALRIEENPAGIARGYAYAKTGFGITLEQARATRSEEFVSGYQRGLDQWRYEQTIHASRRAMLEQMSSNATLLR